jgi:hypothetical protein
MTDLRQADPVLTSPPQLRADLFLATDRCDRCAAPAQTRVELSTGELQFCLRHFRKHRTVLEAVTVSPTTFAF